MSMPEFAVKVAQVGGVVLRCRKEAARGASEAARRRFTGTAQILAEIEREAQDLACRLVAQRLRSAALSTQGDAYDVGFYDAASEVLRRLHGGGFDFDAAIGFVEDLEAAARVPLSDPGRRDHSD